MTPALFQDIVLIFVLSVPIVVVLRKIHFPIIIGFLVTGALIGPSALNLIPDQQRIQLLAELGLAFLLFTIGIEFSFESFTKVRKKAAVLGLGQILLTALVGTGLGLILDWPLIRCLYFGCVLALSSSAIVLSVMFAKRMLQSVPGQITTVLLVMQDLAFVLMIVILPLVGGTYETFDEFISQSYHSIIALTVLSLIFTFGKTLLSKVLKTISHIGRREVFVIAIMAITLGLSWFSHTMGLSFALGAFVAGFIIGQTDFRYQALSEITPFRYCFNSLFFVSIGMLLKFDFLFENWLMVISLVLLLPTIKMLIVAFIGSSLRLPFRSVIITALSVAQIGEFSFLLVHQGYNKKIIGAYLHDLIVAAAVFAMMITPWLIHIAPRIADWLQRRLKVKTPASPTHKKQQFKDHVIICGFGPLGEALGSLLEKHNKAYVVLDLNLKNIEHVQKHRKGHAIFGDGTSEEILDFAGIEHAQIICITVPNFLDNIAILKQAKQMNPHIQIITRAKYRTDVQKLYDAGANVVISEELEGGIEMGRYALKYVGIPHDEVKDLILSIREYGSADFF